MKSTEDRRVRSSDGMVEGRVDGRIEMCRSGIEFDCCQGEVFVVAIWAASGTRKSVSLGLTGLALASQRSQKRPRKRSGDVKETVCLKSWGMNRRSARALG